MTWNKQKRHVRTKVFWVYNKRAADWNTTVDFQNLTALFWCSFTISRLFYFAFLLSVFDNKKLQKTIYAESIIKSKTKNMMSAMIQKIKLLEQITSNTHMPLSKIRFFVMFMNFELYEDRRRENHFFAVQKWHQMDDGHRQTEN